MRKLFSIILPPGIAFLLFATAIKYHPLATHIGGLADIGNETLYGLIGYFKIFTPLLFVTALLTQLLIVLPLWKKVTTAKRFLGVFGIICLLTTLLALSVSYLIWDNATGVRHLVLSVLFMDGVQLIYWVIDFGVLFLIHRKRFKTVSAEPEQLG